MEYVLACDVGTSTLKLALVNPEGKVSKLRIRSVKDLQSSFQFREIILTEVSQIASFVQKNQGCIVSIIITGNGPSIVLPKNDSPISLNKSTKDIFFWHEILPFLDEKKAHLFEKLKALGSFFLPRIFLASIVLEGGLLDCTNIFSLPEYLSFCLTGNAFTFLPNFRFENAYWTQESLKTLEKALFETHQEPFDLAKKIPPFIQAGSVVGSFKGIPVVAGAPDFYVALIGTATIKDHTACDRIGTSEGLNVCLSEKPNDASFRILPSVFERLWNVSTLLGKVTLNFETVAKEPQAKKLLKDASYYNYIEKFQEAFAQVKKICLKDTLFMVTGGLSQSEELCNLKASLTGHRFCLTQTPHAELLGGAALAYTSLKYFPSLEKACERLVHITKSFEPKVF